MTLALTGVAAAATPDRAPAQGAGTAGTSPAPDPVPQPVRVSPTHSSTPPVTVTPVSSAPETRSHSAPTTSERAASAPVERPAATPVEPARPERRTAAPARKHHPPAAHQQHRATGPVTVDLPVPRISPPKLFATGRETEPNGVLLLLSSLSLGLLVVASLTLLQRVKRLNGGGREPVAGTSRCRGRDRSVDGCEWRGFGREHSQRDVHFSRPNERMRPIRLVVYKRRFARLAGKPDSDQSGRLCIDDLWRHQHDGVLSGLVGTQRDIAYSAH